MSKSLFLLLVVALIEANGQKPILPGFYGVGYDIIRGNPLTNDYDPGFRSQLFEFTFNQNRETEDTLYKVPDYVTARTKNLCSRRATSNEYASTADYQKQLRNLVQVSSEYDGLVVKASFSVSTEYKKMDHSTRLENSVVIESQADCRAYEVEVSIK
jgi:hypothetical protein